MPNEAKLTHVFFGYRFLNGHKGQKTDSKKYIDAQNPYLALPSVTKVQGFSCILFVLQSFFHENKNGDFELQHKEFLHLLSSPDFPYSRQNSLYSVTKG